MELGTHIEVACVHGGWKDFEKKQAKGLWDSIPDDPLLMEDRGFFSYDSGESLYLKQKLLIRVTKSMVFQPIEILSDGSYLATIYKNS